MKQNVKGYNLYGLKINSSLPLVNFKSRAPYAHPDVNLTFGKIKPVEPNLPQTVYTPFNTFNADFFIKDIPTIAKYAIYNRKEVVIEMYKPQKPKATLFFFYDTILPILLISNDYFPVHASAVSTDSGVHLFSGKRGDGKSSIATALCLKDYKFVSDDICILKWDKENKQFITKCYNPMINIWGDVFPLFKEKGTKKYQPRLIRKGILKYSLDFSKNAQKKYQKVNSINLIILENVDIPISHTPIKGIEKINVSKNIIHSHGIANVVAKSKSLFLFSGLVAKHLNINRLHRSRIHSIPNFSNYIINEIFTETAN